MSDVPLGKAHRDEIIQALACGLDVFHAFGPGHERLTITEVAKACGLTRARARRILLTLVTLGYVELQGRDFALTAKVLELSSGYLKRSLWEQAELVLREVVEELNETASIGVLHELDVVYVRRVRASRPIHIELHEGEYVPAHISSVGRMLLASLDPAQLTDYLGNIKLVQYTPQTVTDRDLLFERITEARRSGWCYVEGEFVEGITGVAVPIVDNRGVTVASLVIGTMSRTITKSKAEQQIVPTLRRATKKISGMIKRNSSSQANGNGHSPFTDWCSKPLPSLAVKR